MGKFIVESVENGVVTLAVPGSNYRNSFLLQGDASGLPPGTRVHGTIYAPAWKVDRVELGGNYVEPLFGRPRRMQGTILSVNPAANELTVQVGYQATVSLPEGYRADEYKVGERIGWDNIEMPVFEPAASAGNRMTNTSRGVGWAITNSRSTIPRPASGRRSAGRGSGATHSRSQFGLFWVQSLAESAARHSHRQATTDPEYCSHSRQIPLNPHDSREKAHCLFPYGGPSTLVAAPDLNVPVAIGSDMELIHGFADGACVSAINRQLDGVLIEESLQVKIFGISGS